MKKLALLPGLLAAAFVGTVVAAPVPTQEGYYVVVPLAGRAEPAAAGIDVSLGQGALPPGLVGIPYNGYDFKPLLAVSGDEGYTGYGVHWNVVSGSLPAGLTLNADGTLSGTPTTTGTSIFEIGATYKTKTGQSEFQVFVSQINVVLASGTPPQAIEGQFYSYDLKPLLNITGDGTYAGSGVGVTWTVLSSSLPNGLFLRTDGTISGTPTASGSGTLTARASYRGSSGEQTYEIITLAINVSLASAAPPQALVGQAYSYDLKNLLSVTGDSGYDGSGVTWSVVATSLPVGLYLKNDGTIAGTPTAAGTGEITARATYRGNNGQQTYQVVSLDINVLLATATPHQAIVGQAYGYDLKNLLTITGDNGYSGSDVTWTVVSDTLPAGLSLRSNGVIAGTPTAAGAGAITARATYRGNNGQQTYQVTTLDINVSLAADTPPQAIVGQAYSYDLKPKLSVTGDNAYTGAGVIWTVVSSTLPAGLSLRSDGTIAGTPTASGSGSVVARATYRGNNGQQTYQVVSLDIVVALATATPPQAIVGQAYTYDLKPLLTVTGDNSYSGTGVTWTLTSGTLPNGLTLNSSGVITGTPTSASSGNVTARATYRNVNGQQVYQIVSLGITVSLANGAPPQAIVGQAYSYDLKPLLTVSGDAAYTGSGVTWSLVSGSLPSGLALQSDGTITGTPTAAANNSVTARAAYRGVTGQQAYQVVSLNITVALGSATPSTGRVGDAYSYDLKPYLSVTGDSSYTGSGVTWSVVSNTLPTGLSLTAAGVISGTPSVAATGSVTARATYRGNNGQQTYNVTVTPAYTFSWTTGGWSTPSACGSTTSTRSVSCLRSDGVTVADANCSGGKPASTQAASDYSACTFSWQSSGWSTPAACGATTATRSVWCQRSDGSTVSDASCGGGKPATSQSTSDYSSCSYSWATSGWSTPSACGATTATRSVWCQRSDGSTVGDASCGGGKPASSQASSDYSSCSYSFTYGSWSTPAGCGAVTQTRSATCKRSDGATVSNSYCGTPVTSQTGSDYSSCTYSFNYGSWGSCSASCGGGTQTRSASCKRSDGSTVSNSYCGTPTTSQSCNTQACAPTYTYSFVYSGWSACSATCGGGTQTRSVSCQRNDGATVANSYCGTPGSTSQSCNTAACPTNYTWSYSGYKCQTGNRFAVDNTGGTKCSSPGATTWVDTGVDGCSATDINATDWVQYTCR